MLNKLLNFSENKSFKINNAVSAGIMVSVSVNSSLFFVQQKVGRVNNKNNEIEWTTEINNGRQETSR